MLWVTLIKALTLRLLQLWSPGRERSWEESSDLRKMPKALQYFLASNQKHQKQVQWIKQKKTYQNVLLRFRQGSLGLQVQFPDSMGLNWSDRCRDPCYRGWTKWRSFDSVWKRIFTCFLCRKAWLWFSSAKSVCFFAEGGLVSHLLSRTAVSSLVSIFTAQARWCRIVFFLSSLCLQELLLPVSLTRVVQAHQSRAICSEIFERQSTSFCATRKHVLVLMIVVLSSLMHPRFLNMTRECLTATFAVAR